VIARGSEPMVRLTPVTPPKAVKRQFGRYKGQFELTDAFFEPLSEEELALWEGGDVSGCCSIPTPSSGGSKAINACRGTFAA